MGLFGAALGAAGSIFGGISAAKAMRAASRDLEEQRKENKNWFTRRYNEDATNRADAQALLRRTENAIKKRNKAAAGTAAVMGGTDAGAAATAEANAQAMADTNMQILADAEKRKDRAEEQYMETDRNLRGQQNQMKVQQAQAIAGAVQGVTNMASALPI